MPFIFVSKSWWIIKGNIDFDQPLLQEYKFQNCFHRRGSNANLQKMAKTFVWYLAIFVNCSSTFWIRFFFFDGESQNRCCLYVIKYIHVLKLISPLNHFVDNKSCIYIVMGGVEQGRPKPIIILQIICPRLIIFPGYVYQ